MTANANVQTVLFSKDLWTIANSREWLKKHGFNFNKVDSRYSKNYYRWRQKPPKKNYKYYTIDLGKGIMLVLHE